MAESAKQALRTEGTKCILLVFKIVFAHELLKFHEYVLQERVRTVSQAHAGEVCPAPLQEMGTRRAIGGQQERGPKAPDPPITTAACRHAWGGLSHPLQQECVFGCKFPPSPRSPQLGMIHLPELAQCTSSPFLHFWGIWNILWSEGNIS